MEEIDKRIALFLDVGDGYGDGNGGGNGNGYGYGYGYGNGYGNGYGDGYTDGYGYGYGYGYGNGDGDGYGYGYGYVSGYGYGNGNGNGGGNGYGILEFNGHKVYCIDNIPTIILNVRGNIAQGYIIKYNSLLEPCYIAKVDDCFAHGKTEHNALLDALRDATAKALAHA